MTLVEFISSVCKEVFTEEGFMDGKKQKKTETHIQKKATSKLITEDVLKTMIKNGTVTELTNNSRFTPLARDLWTDYKNKKS